MDTTHMQPPPLSHRSTDLDGLVALEKTTRAGPPAARLAWARQLLRHVRRTLPAPAQPASSHPKTLTPDSTKPTNNLPTDPVLAGLLDQALTFVLSLAHPAQPPPTKDIVYAEALFVSADLSATGEFPSYKVKDLRTSFRSFESSARAGWQGSWYRLGRDYESVGDPTRAVECFERGVKGMDKSSLYRLGMALLLGQLSLAKDQPRSISLLRQAADLADEDLPTPAYLFGMLLAGEVDLPVKPASLLLPHQVPPPPSTPASTQSALLSLALHYLLRSAHLGSPQAQLRIGQAFEHATLDCPFDPLLSVQWYLVASQNGEEEADMGLAKWFLVGADGYLEKNEGLAFSFAEKAAKRGLAAGLFGVGYFYELGIGRTEDLGKARKYYKRAAHLSTQDAIARLAALTAPTPAPLSQAEHLSHVETKLVRKRTDAKARSERNMSISRSVPGQAPSGFVLAPPPPSTLIQPPTPTLSSGGGGSGGIREVILPAGGGRRASGGETSPRRAQHQQPYHPVQPPNTPYQPAPPSPQHRPIQYPPSPYPSTTSPYLQQHHPAHPQQHQPYPTSAYPSQHQHQHHPPPSPQPQGTPQLKRYTLADVPMSPLPAPPIQTARPAGPQTFEEMGIAGKKAGTEADCVVM